VKSLISSLLISLFLIGCTSLPEPTGEPIEHIQDLENTLTAFYNAEKSKDWKTYWSYLNPSAQEDMPYTEFVEYMKDASNLTNYKILSIKNYGADKDSPDRIKASVEVIVETTIKHSANRYGIDKSMDFWWLLDGRWVWVVRK